LAHRPALSIKDTFVTRHLTTLLVICLGTLLFAWPASAENEDTTRPRPVAVCSTTQIHDFVRQVVGDRFEVASVLGPNEDPHMFQITPQAAQQVQQADICFDNGLHLEGGDWMRTLAEQAGKNIVSCTRGIQPLELAVNGESQQVPDPHAWFSPMNAAVYVRNIHEAVVAIDPDRKREYDARAALYLDQLRTLHLWIQRQINSIPVNQRVLVTSHDAFNYFCDTYELTSSTPVGWSTQEVGAEVTPRRRQEVIDSIRDSGVPAIFVETSVNPELIREIASEAGVEIGGKLYSDAMGAAGSAGESYVGMMRENVITIVSALR
jgi:manganese/iron transport system substrate-binding protein